MFPVVEGGRVLWTHQFGSSTADYGQSVSVDADGNVLVGGYTDGSLPGWTNAGSYDAFVRKLDADGNELWTHQFGTSSDDYAHSVSVDADGNVLVAGHTYGAFAGQTNAGNADVFVRKLDADGNELWTHQFGSSDYDIGQSLSVDANRNVLVAGYTGGSLPGQPSAGGSDVFVRKLDADGNELWTGQFGSSGYEFGQSVSVDADGNVVVAGYTGGALLGQTNAGGYDVFVRKLSDAGGPIWTYQFGSSTDDYGQSVSVDVDGNVVVAGYTFGALLGQTNAGSPDAFVRKLDADRNELWTRQFGSNTADYGQSVSVDADGNVLVGGYTGGSLPGQTNAGGFDVFVRKLDADGGNELWTRQFGSSSADYGQSVSVRADGTILIAGFTGGSLPGQTSAGSGDAFVTALAAGYP